MQSCQDVSDLVVRLNEKGCVMLRIVGDKPLAGAVTTADIYVPGLPVAINPLYWDFSCFHVGPYVMIEKRGHILICSDLWVSTLKWELKMRTLMITRDLLKLRHFRQKGRSMMMPNLNFILNALCDRSTNHPR